MELNRRDFLKGALATSALAASGAALAGCAPAQGAGSASSSDAKDQGELLTTTSPRPLLTISLSWGRAWRAYAQRYRLPRKVPM